MLATLRTTLRIWNTSTSVLRLLSTQKQAALYSGTTKVQLSRSQVHLPFRYSSSQASNPTSNDGATKPSVLCTTREFSPSSNIGTITISNPAKINIVNSELLAQMTAACKYLSSDSLLRAVILTGSTAPLKTASFIGGADISEMATLDSAESARSFIMKIHAACEALRDLPVPVIARVKGYALGAGLEIMAACDLRICTRDSVFGMPEVKVGIPSVVEAALLPGLIGMGRTRRFLYLAENIPAEVAERWGLVDQVVKDAEALDAAVEEWVGKLVDMGPKAIRSQKRLMQKWENCSVDEGIMAGVDAYAEAYEDGGKEPKVMMGRFLNRKK